MPDTITHVPVWTDVAAPVLPLLLVSVPMDMTWSPPPMGCPRPGGVFEVSNAIVDKSRGVGAWSSPAILTLKSGWSLWGGSWNQPPVADDIGIVWRVKCVSLEYEYFDYTVGSEHLFNTGSLGSCEGYSANTPYPVALYDNWQRQFKITDLRPGGRNTFVAPAPVVVASQLPNKEFDVFYATVTETGETARSPSLHVVPPTNWSVRQPDTIGVFLNRREYMPQGALGYHVYIQYAGEAEQRVPAPHCYGDPTSPDDWLFQWWDEQPAITRIVPNAPTYVEASNPQSQLTDLHLQLKNGTGSVIVPAGAVYNVTCPVIDEYAFNGGQPPNKFNRSFDSADRGEWTINQLPSQSGHRYWPVIGTYSHFSTFNNLTINGNGASAALATCDWSGDQSFGYTFNNCNFNNVAPAGSVSVGVMTNIKAIAWFNNHSASEFTFNNCKIAADVGLWLSGNQTADWKFNGPTSIYTNSADRRACCVYLETSNQVHFSGACYFGCPNGGAIFRSFAENNGYSGNVIVEDLWVDGGFRCFIDAGNGGFIYKQTNGKLNMWGTVPTDRATLARQIDTFDVSKGLLLSFTNVDIQYSDLAGVDVVGSDYYTVDLRFSDSPLADVVTLIEPTLDQSNAIRSAHGRVLLIPRPMPGLRLMTQPTHASVVVNGIETLSPVPALEIVFNSLTNRQNVQRTDWVAS